MNEKKKTILVIDDDQEIRNNLKEILTILNFEPIIAEDSLDGINLAQEKLPDLILCDITMPKVDGYGVLNALQHNSLTLHIPFIFLTAKSKLTEIREGMNLGADDYLVKPFTLKELKQTIAIRLQKKVKMEEKLAELRYNISSCIPHEFNTPLHGIIASSQLLKNYGDTLERQQIKEMAEIIFDSSQRLHKTIENFILYSKLTLTLDDPEKRALFLNKNQYCMSTITIIDIAQNIAQKLQRSEDLQTQIEDAIVDISQEYFYKIIIELVDNAFKFSQPHKPVEIEGKIINSMYQITISNYGKGMTKKQISEIGAYMQFERKKQEQQGSGLGLTVVKQILTLFGGNFTIESVVDEKTMVIITLPIV